MTGGRMKGVSPSAWKSRPKPPGRRHCDQTSGKATSTERAAADAAIVTDVRRAFRHPGSATIWRYQSSEKPSGGKSSVFSAFTDTPATTTIGAARNSATQMKKSRVGQQAFIGQASHLVPSPSGSRSDTRGPAGTGRLLWVVGSRWLGPEDDMPRVLARCMGYAFLPNISARPTSARLTRTRKTAIAAAKGMFDW
jgi:hypothetical protein